MRRNYQKLFFIFIYLRVKVVMREGRAGYSRLSLYQVSSVSLKSSLPEQALEKRAVFRLFVQSFSVLGLDFASHS